MLKRSALLLLLGSLLGILFATLLQPGPVRGGEVPPELKAPPAPVSQSARDLSRPFVEATRRVRPAVVLIANLRSGWGRKLVRAGTGSGVIISKAGHILTNRHVIAGAQRLDVQLPDGRRFDDVEVIGSDMRSDLAVVKIPAADDLPVAALGDSDALEVGEWVIAIGAPFELEASVSTGVVSATGRTRVVDPDPDFDRSEDFIQTDAALNPGNSGGPLINLDGQVVGINTAIQTAGMRQNAGVGFAVPINLARTVAISLVERGVAKRGWLGVELSALSAAEAAKLGLPAPGGLRVRRVVPGRAAHTGGLREGDVLVSVDGKPIRDLDGLRARLAAAGPGTVVEITVQRDGKRRTLRVRLEEEPIYTFGLEVKTLDADIARNVQLPPDTRGVVITRVDDTSPAKADPEQPLLYPSDVIVAVDIGNRRYPVTNESEFLQAMQAAQYVSTPVVRLWIRVRDGFIPVELARPEVR